MLFEGLEIVVVAACCLVASVAYIRVFQIQRYQLPLYSQWLKRSRDVFLRCVLIGLVAAGLSVYLPMLLSLFIQVETTRSALAGWMMLLGFGAMTAVHAVRDVRDEHRKPFAPTMRARRLLATVGLLLLAVVLVLEILSIPPYAAYAAIPYAVWLGGKIMDPVETRINAGFYDEARRKLRARGDLICIGITGSYGKTLTKFILREILSQKYKVLATPASFNTAMGISRVVNDQLSDKHQVFIAEMGAQHVGDIRNLVRLVQPKYGMITSIGQQHLDTFGSVANVLDTKYELIEGLPDNGAAFFASDSGYTDRLFAKCPKEKYNAAVEQEGDFYMRADEVRTDSKGTHFLLSCADGGRVRCHTRLLGRFNVQNIALAAALARRLGLTMEEIGRGIARLQPFEKKLQLITGDRMTIDDTLCSGAAGAAEALDVLTDFPGRRIVVTSGLGEIGAKGEEADYAFGTQMKGCADSVILVGERPALSPLLRGLADSGFPRSAVHVVADAEDAADLLDEISGSGDSVLYEGELAG